MNLTSKCIILFFRRLLFMASLQLKNIYKTYPGGFTAVKDFNLDIEDKEFVI